MANGILIPGLIEVEVVNNGHFSADRLSASFALDAPSIFGEAFWSSELDIIIDVLFSLDSISFVSLFTGTIDSVALNATKRLVHITGRDFSARFIEARTQETFSNRTSSEIASLLAARHGLSTNVVSTTTPVGRYYQDEHDRITLGQFSQSTTEWDLLVFLALQEGFDVAVSGTTLNFSPTNNVARAPYVITPGDCIDLKLNRSLTLARNIEVTIKTWNSRKKSAFSQTASGINIAGSSSAVASPPVQYLFVRPNLTADQASRFAQDKLNELTMHERMVEFIMPGDLLLTPNSQLIMSGTGTQFDQIYNIDVVERRLSLSEGFMQTVRAKASSPRSTSVNQTGTAVGTAGS
jgi:phage protein D